MWRNNILHFGLRGCTEQRNLCWGDVVLETDSEGKEYLVQRQTKRRQGDNSRNFGPVKPRMYDKEKIQEECNPVNVYHLYRDRVLHPCGPVTGPGVPWGFSSDKLLQVQSPKKFFVILIFPHGDKRARCKALFTFATQRHNDISITT